MANGQDISELIAQLRDLATIQSERIDDLIADVAKLTARVRIIEPKPHSPLAPCPFCGGEAKIVESHNVDEWYEVYCTGCLIVGRKQYSISETARQWNIRTPESGRDV